jgi:hypothetical protein
MKHELMDIERQTKVALPETAATKTTRALKELDFQFTSVRNQLRYVQVKNDSLKRLRNSLNKLKDNSGFQTGEARRQIE